MTGLGGTQTIKYCESNKATGQTICIECDTFKSNMNMGSSNSSQSKDAGEQFCEATSQFFNSLVSIAIVLERERSRKAKGYLRRFSTQEA